MCNYRSINHSADGVGDGPTLAFIVAEIYPLILVWNRRVMCWCCLISNWWFRHLLWNCPNMNVTGFIWWSVHSQHWFRQWLGAVRQPEPILTQISVVIWRHCGIATPPPPPPPPPPPDACPYSTLLWNIRHFVSWTAHVSYITHAHFFWT